MTSNLVYIRCDRISDQHSVHCSSQVRLLKFLHVCDLELEWLAGKCFKTAFDVSSKHWDLRLFQPQILWMTPTTTLGSEWPHKQTPNCRFIASITFNSLLAYLNDLTTIQTTILGLVNESVVINQKMLRESYESQLHYRHMLGVCLESLVCTIWTTYFTFPGTTYKKDLCGYWRNQRDQFKAMFEPISKNMLCIYIIRWTDIQKNNRIYQTKPPIRRVLIHCFLIYTTSVIPG